MNKKEKKEKDEKEKEKLARKKIINKILKKYGYTEEKPEVEYKKEIDISKTYTQYKKEEKEQKKINWYEASAKIAQKIFRCSAPRGEKKEDLDQAIEFIGYNVRVEETISLTYLATILSLPVAFIPIFLTSIGLPVAKIIIILFLFLPLIVYFYFDNFIKRKAKILRIKAGSDLVIAVLYLIIYMKTTPNLEGAIRFASKNMIGKIPNDFKLLLWKVEIGKYSTVYDALNDYLDVWYGYNQDFIESIHLIRESMLETNPYRREMLLDKSVSVILEGTQENMKKYARNLSMPIAMLHGLGIILPVLAMLMFPLMAIFMGDIVNNMVFYMFIGYDILLPLFIFLLMKNIMETRPITHTTVDISEHPDYTKSKSIVVKIFDKKIKIPIIPIVIFSFLFLALPGISFMFQTDFFYTHPVLGGRLEPSFFSMLMSVSLIIATTFAGVLYYYLSSFQKIHLTKEIDAVEREFEDALFALGNRMSGGVPIEVAIVNAQKDTHKLNITKLFLRILQNINQFSMDFTKALFDTTKGAMLYYPSRLIKTIMKVVSSAVEKSTRSASLSTLTIATYLHSLKKTQEVIDELMSPTISSLKFQSYLLIPMISGVIVCVSKLMMTITFVLTKQMEKISEATAVSEAGFSSFEMGGIISPNPVPPEMLQLIVGLYLIEMLILMAKFTVRIDTGTDEIKEDALCWHYLLFGVAMYLIVYIVIGAMFDPMISGITQGLEGV